MVDFTCECWKTEEAEFKESGGGFFFSLVLPQPVVLKIVLNPGGGPWPAQIKTGVTGRTRITGGARVTGGVCVTGGARVTGCLATSRAAVTNSVGPRIDVPG